MGLVDRIVDSKLLDRIEEDGLLDALGVGLYAALAIVLAAGAVLTRALGMWG